MSEAKGLSIRDSGQNPDSRKQSAGALMFNLEIIPRAVKAWWFLRDCFRMSYDLQAMGQKSLITLDSFLLWRSSIPAWKRSWRKEWLSFASAMINSRNRL